MDRYRVRLKNGRVLGPFVVDQFSELFNKGHISGNEECQIFPIGDWKSLKLFPDLLNAITQNNTHVQNDSTFIRKIADIEKNSEKILSTENIELQQNQIFPKEFVFEKEEVFLKDESNHNEKDLNTTIVSDVKQINDDKTVINNDTLKYLEELKKIEALKKEEEAKQEKVEIVPQIDYQNDSTQFLNLSEIKNDLKLEINKSEKELLKEEKIEIKKIKEKEHELLDKNDSEKEEEDEEEESSSKSRSKLLLVIFVCAFVFLYFYDPTPQKQVAKISPVYPKIEFPQRFEVSNKEISNQKYLEGLKYFKTQNYIKMLQSVKFFKAAIENDFENLNAMAKLIYIYSAFIDEFSDQSEASNKVFKLVQINLTKAYKNPELSAAIANYFFQVKKFNAALNVVEKFNAIKTNQPTLELFAIYLDTLMEVGNVIKAKAVFEKLFSVKDRPFQVDISLINYFLKNSEIENANNLIKELDEKNPNNVKILLLKCQVSVYNSDFDKLAFLLKQIQSLQAGSSPKFYAQFLEYRGMLAVSKNEVDKAIKLFKKSLSLRESSGLRTKLALLNMGENEEVNVLISESKALQEINKAKVHIKNKNWKFAFVSALEASRIAPSFLKAQIFLADLKVKLNFYQEAIDTLEKLYADFPKSKELLFSLTEAYIAAFKFDSAKNLLAIIATSEFKSDPNYYKLTANYYLMKDDFNSAVLWLKEAINRNPIDDELIFSLAKLFIKYNRFESAKLLLSKSMDLDPSEIEYKIAYSNIIYEVDGVNAAVGYLYDLLSDFPDNPQIYSTIGIYYYKSGQLKSFEQIKSKLNSLPKIDETLYDFLIKAAQLDDKTQDVIEYSKKLIRINPYNIQIKMNLGKIYLENELYEDAIAIFNEIRKNSPSYPMLQFYLSKLYLILDDIDKAIEFAKNEIEINPTSENGHNLLGDIYLKQEKYIEAEAEYKKAQKNNTKSIDTLLGLAQINFKKNQYELALDLYNKALAIDGNRPEIYKLLGDVYRKIGQSDLAVKSYKTFLELSPSTKYREQLNTYIKTME